MPRFSLVTASFAFAVNSKFFLSPVFSLVIKDFVDAGLSVLSCFVR